MGPPAAWPPRAVVSPRSRSSWTLPLHSVISRPRTGRSWNQRLKRRAGRSPSRAERRRRPPRGRPDVAPHLKILHTVAEAVSRTLDVEEVLRTALDALTRVTGHEIASLHLLSEDGKTLELRGSRGMSARLREANTRLPVGEGLIGHVAVNGKTVRIERNYEDPNVLPSAKAAVRREQILGFVCVPIHSRGRILGTLALGRKPPARSNNPSRPCTRPAPTQAAVRPANQNGK